LQQIDKPNIIERSIDTDTLEERETLVLLSINYLA